MVAVDSTLFPNYLQMRERVPVWVWHTLGAGMVVGALGLIAVLFVAPRTGLIAWWLFVLPVLPLLLMLAPGVWRNVCPMAALNQYPRVFGFSRGKTVPPWLKSNAVLLQAVLYFALISTRAPIFDHNGAAVGALMLVALGAAFGGGIVFKGKSGWCGTFCPLMPMQRLYGQTPAVVIPNAHCRPCVGCTKNCYDFNPHVAAVADANDEDQHYLGQRKVFAAAFPGFVLAFFTIPHSHVGEPADIGISVADFYLWTGGYMLISIGAFFLLDALSPVTPLMLMALFGAIGLNLHNILRFPTAFAFDKPVWLLGIEYAAVAAVTAVFLVRTRRKERRLDELALEPLPVRLGAGAESALRHAADDERPEVVIVPEDRRIAVAPGSSLLEIVERAGLPIEAGCRLGVCGSDPVCIVSGADNLSPIEADEQATLERLGLAESTRMACSTRVLGTVSVSLVPERKQVRAGPAAEPADPSIGRVVVVGNGIAGVTAADYVRRGHPTCEIDLIGREGHHLYNRMAITRLIYGRSAMQGLYLLPESWYDEHGISCWLNTRVLAIDRTRKEVQLATGDVLGYDRLILTGGSASFVPPIEGFGTPGTFPLRTADDAMAIRGYLQDHRCREPVVVGAGLLGLEAAYALHKLGLHPTVLARGQLLQRELDEPGSRFLRRFLEG
ncbi:MAG: FAD-dependent oxidoreductase, partial [Gaiellaceae bacterium]